MSSPREDLELIQQHLQNLRLTPVERRKALAGVRLGQRLATVALLLGSPRAVRQRLAALVVEAAPAQQSRQLDPRNSD